MLTPYNDCSDVAPTSEYFLNAKHWLLGFFGISLLHTLLIYILDHFKILYIEGRMTYRHYSRLVVSIVVIQEVVHAAWQVFGNLIFYEKHGSTEENASFQTCIRLNNPGISFIFIFALCIGYAYFSVYLLVFCGFCAFSLRRLASRQSRIRHSKRILQSLSHVRYSEQLFGAISPENECIICLSQFCESDTITRLECSPRHFFHSNCIESWINSGGTQCPICRAPLAVNEGNEENQARPDEEFRQIN